METKLFEERNILGSLSTDSVILAFHFALGVWNVFVLEFAEGSGVADGTAATHVADEANGQVLERCSILSRIDSGNVKAYLRSS